jgi:hypothetical protein
MRYLKKYKIFESNKKKHATEKELDTIEQILFGIEDLDFDVEIHKNIGGQNKRLEISSEVCRVYIENFAVYGFSSERRECNFTPDYEFISTLKHLVSYVDEIEYDIKIESVLDSEVKDSFNSKYGELSDSDIEKFGQSDISYIMITISYKD